MNLHLSGKEDTIFWTDFSKSANSISCKGEHSEAQNSFLDTQVMLHGIHL